MSISNLGVHPVALGFQSSGKPKPAAGFGRCAAIGIRSPVVGMGGSVAFGMRSPLGFWHAVAAALGLPMGFRDSGVCLPVPFGGPVVCGIRSPVAGLRGSEAFGIVGCPVGLQPPSAPGIRPLDSGRVAPGISPAPAGFGPFVSVAHPAGSSAIVAVAVATVGDDASSAPWFGKSCLRDRSPRTFSPGLQSWFLG